MEFAKLKEDVDTVRVGVGDVAPTACVTLMVLEATPVPLMVIVVVRCVVPVLAPVVTVTVPLLEPEAGETVHQFALLLTVQLVLEEIVNV